MRNSAVRRPSACRRCWGRKSQSRRNRNPTRRQRPPPRRQEIAQAIRQLDSDDFRTREQAADKLRKSAKAPWQPYAKSNSPVRSNRRRAPDALLSEIARPQPLPPAPLAWEIQYGRIARWYEQRAKLKWDEGQKRYVPR